MTLSKLLNGRHSSLTLCFFISVLGLHPAHALHEDFVNQNYMRPAWVGVGALTGIYVVSQLNDGPIFFGTLHGLSSLYLIHSLPENLSRTQMIVPLATLAMSILNFALLNNNDKYSKHDVFLYNTLGVGSIVSYAIWQHSTRGGSYTQNKFLKKSTNRSFQWSVYPLISQNSIIKKSFGTSFEMFF